MPVPYPHARVVGEAGARRLALPSMGQPVAVERKSGGSAAVVRFETNRSLTGQGHERYRSAVEAKGTKSGAVVARRLLESGQVTWVHVYGNVVTAELAPGASQAGLDEIVRDLYQYWKPGMAPPSIEELMAQMPAEAAPAAASAGGEGAPGGGLDPRVPAHLWERSQAALAKWRAKNG